MSHKQDIPAQRSAGGFIYKQASTGRFEHQPAQRQRGVRVTLKQISQQDQHRFLFEAARKARLTSRR